LRFLTFVFWFDSGKIHTKNGRAIKNGNTLRIKKNTELAEKYENCFFFRMRLVCVGDMLC